MLVFFWIEEEVMKKKQDSIQQLRAITYRKSIEKRKKIYQMFLSDIKGELMSMDIWKLSKMMILEKESFLQEIECEILSEKLLSYVGPISLDYLDMIFPYLSIANIWSLASDAEFDLLRNKAFQVLTQILETYNLKGGKYEKYKK